MKTEIVFLPGLGMKEPIFEFQVKSLQDFNTQVIVLDHQDTLDEMVNAVLSKAPKQFCLLGHSMGGWVAQKVAATAPERVQKLILVSTFARSNPKTQNDYNQALFAIEHGQMEAVLISHTQEAISSQYQSDPVFMNRLRELQMMQPGSVYIRQLKAMIAHPDILADLKKITCPTLIIAGKEDRVIPLEEQLCIQNHIPNSKLTILENCAHLAPLEQKEALTALIRQWFQFA